MGEQGEKTTAHVAEKSETLWGMTSEPNMVTHVSNASTQEPKAGGG